MKLKTLLFGLLLALLLGTCPGTAQENKPNTNTPVYNEAFHCFSDGDTKKVNALWHVVGDQWRAALAHDLNDEIRYNLYGKPREFVHDGVTYYRIAKNECLWVPAPIKAQFPLEGWRRVIGDVLPPRPSQGSPTQISQPLALSWPEEHPGIFLLYFVAGVIIVLVFLHNLFMAAMSRESRFRQPVPDGPETIDPETYIDPAFDGEPMLAGGLEHTPQADQIKTATAVLADLATRTFVPGAKSDEFRVVGDIVRGTLDGEGMVEYATGQAQLRQFRSTPAFQAMMEHIPTGQRQLMCALWACANGCYKSMVTGDNYTFTPGTDQSDTITRIAPVIVPTGTDLEKYGQSQYTGYSRELNGFEENLLRAERNAFGRRRDWSGYNGQPTAEVQHETASK